MDQADDLWRAAEQSRDKKDYDAVLSYLEGGDTSSCDAKWRLARACKDCAHAAGDKKVKEALLNRGLQFADAALQLPDAKTNFKVPLWKGIMLGQCSDHMGISDKVKGAPEIRDQFAAAIALNGNDAESKHCLGQWMFALADMNWVGRQASSLLGLKGTYEEAIELFQAAEQAEPDFYLTNKYMIGLCCKKLKQFPESAHWLEQVLAGPSISPDEQKAHVDAAELLENVRGKMK